MKCIPSLLAVCVVFLLAGCGGSGKAPWTGAFNSPAAGGVMQLTQNGATVTGTYPLEGHLEGTVEGHRLTFKWWQGPGAADGYQGAARNARGDGYFVIDANGGGFDGHYRLEGKSDWADVWYGIRER